MEHWATNYTNNIVKNLIYTRKLKKSEIKELMRIFCDNVVDCINKYDILW